MLLNDHDDRGLMATATSLATAVQMLHERDDATGWRPFEGWISRHCCSRISLPRCKAVIALPSTFVVRRKRNIKVFMAINCQDNRKRF
ncbi:hypothetical protein L484_015428 [Morus notabilis]|uniref:Uncharacterized protein n=1 Tax=Morus notabilis TaxID=981085 RepID=W9R9J6_9ROSA|nr:hypothetical protein L484_015428 [Morus notabilis]